MPEYDGLLALDRMERAVEKVRDRLLRSTAALESAGVPYAVIGGNAVMAWVEQVDESAVRFTQDVDIVLRREDLGRATEALAKAGFTHRHVAGIDMFLDGPGAGPRDAVHVIFSGEKVRPEYVVAVPDAAESVAQVGPVDPGEPRGPGVSGRGEPGGRPVGKEGPPAGRGLAR